MRLPWVGRRLASSAGFRYSEIGQGLLKKNSAEVTVDGRHSGPSYFEVNLAVIWSTVNDDLPNLIPQLEAILESNIDFHYNDLGAQFP